MTHDDKRHGTRPLFVALDVTTGGVIGKCYSRRRAAGFCKCLDEIGASVPGDLDGDLVMDNYATRKTPLIRKWLTRRPRWHVQLTPTSVSWLNQGERFFAFVTERKIKLGAYQSDEVLEADLADYIASRNAEPKPFSWIESADDIVASIERLCLRTMPPAKSRRTSYSVELVASRCGVRLRAINNALFRRGRCKLLHCIYHRSNRVRVIGKAPHPALRILQIDRRGVVDVVDRLGGVLHHRRFNARLISLVGAKHLLARAREDNRLGVDRCSPCGDGAAADLRSRKRRTFMRMRARRGHMRARVLTAMHEATRGVIKARSVDVNEHGFRANALRPQLVDSRWHALQRDRARLQALNVAKIDQRPLAEQVGFSERRAPGRFDQFELPPERRERLGAVGVVLTMSLALTNDLSGARIYCCLGSLGRQRLARRLRGRLSRACGDGDQRRKSKASLKQLPDHAVTLMKVSTIPRPASWTNPVCQSRNSVITG